MRASFILYLSQSVQDLFRWRGRYRFTVLRWATSANDEVFSKPPHQQDKQGEVMSTQQAMHVRDLRVVPESLETDLSLRPVLKVGKLRRRGGQELALDLSLVAYTSSQ